MCEYNSKYPNCNFLGMHYHIPCICPDITCLCNRTPKHTAYRAPCGNLSHDIKCQCHVFAESKTTAFSEMDKMLKEQQDRLAERKVDFDKASEALYNYAFGEGTKIPEGKTTTSPDLINYPPHYTKGGAKCSCGRTIECIDITRHLGFNLGNAVKYIWRCDLKGNSVEDLKKAVFYLNDEIRKREEAVNEPQKA